MACRKSICKLNINKYNDFDINIDDNFYLEDDLKKIEEITGKGDDDVDEYEKLKSDILENGYRLYEKLIFVTGFSIVPLISIKWGSRTISTFASLMLPFFG